MIDPAGHRILVLPEEVDEKLGSFYLPQEVRARMGDEQIFGTVVAIGKNAFKAFDDGHAWCEIGDRVAFAKYGGFIIREPGEKTLYRILNDEDIVAVLRESPNGNE